MTQNQLYIEDTLVDLPENSVVALSFAVNTLFEMKTVQGVVSNRIALPLTSNNLKACGFPNDLNIDFSKTIRRRKKARFLQNGVEIIPDGNVQIDGVDAKGINALITAGNVDFFELINGSIRTLDLSEWDHVWNFQNVVSSRGRSEGFVYPVIQYGQILEEDTYINVRHLRPATFVHTIVSKIVEETGYKLNNVIEQIPEYNDFYKSLILPFSLDSFVHSQRYLDKNKSDAVLIKRTDTFRYENKSPVIVSWQQKIQDADNLFSLTTNKYTANKPFYAKIKVKFPHVHTSRTWNTGISDGPVGFGNPGGFITLILFRNNQATILARHQFLFLKGKYRMDFYNVEVAADVELLPGDQVYLEVLGCNRPEGLTAADVILSEGTLSIDLAGDKVLYGQEVQIESTLPDFAKKDFLKFIAGVFCSIIHTDNINQTVHIVPFKKIKDNIPFAYDWSDKIHNEQPPTFLSIGDYGQNNLAKYKKDSAVIPENLGWGNLVIGDENLPIERTLFELPFAASMEANVFELNRTVIINKVPAEKLIEPGGGFKPIADMNGTEVQEFTKWYHARHDYSVRTEPRIAMLFRRQISLPYTEAEVFGVTSSATVTFQGDIPFAHFITPAGSSTTLDLQTVLENYYPDFSIMLNDQRRIVQEMLLNELDIADLDFFKPVYIRKFSSYFYIAKVSDVVGANKLCKVELVKLY